MSGAGREAKWLRWPLSFLRMSALGNRRTRLRARDGEYIGDSRGKRKGGCRSVTRRRLTAAVGPSAPLVFELTWNGRTVAAVLQRERPPCGAPRARDEECP